MKFNTSLILSISIFFASSLGACKYNDKEQSSDSNASVSNEQPSTALNQLTKNIPQVSQKHHHQAMILGSFHFNRGTDGSDVVSKNHIDIKTEENQKQIEQIAERIATQFKPTIIAVEWMPRVQPQMDSLYTAYQNNTWKLGKNESFQLGFRIAKKLNLATVYCIDNRPPQPESINEIDDIEEYAKSLNQEKVWHEYDEDNSRYTAYMDSLKARLDLKTMLSCLNSRENAQRSKELWLTGIVNLGHGDTYLGADFTGNWYRRNTRIFVNARNLCKSKNERILIIYGNAHKWVLDELFDASPEFQLYQPDEFLY